MEVRRRKVEMKKDIIQKLYYFLIGYAAEEPAIMPKFLKRTLRALAVIILIFCLIAYVIPLFFYWIITI